jgi:hypothetical protein
LRNSGIDELRHLGIEEEGCCVRFSIRQFLNPGIPEFLNSRIPKSFSEGEEP